MGYKFHAVFSDAFSNEKRITMKAFGATVTDVMSDNVFIFIHSCIFSF
jgi:cysteine synthase A